MWKQYGNPLVAQKLKSVLGSLGERIRVLGGAHSRPPPCRESAHPPLPAVLNEFFFVQNFHFNAHSSVTEHSASAPLKRRTTWDDDC